MTKWLFNIGLLITCFLLFANGLFAQRTDSLINKRISVDTLNRLDSPTVRNKAKVESVLRQHSPKKAALRSLILPGWGQIYNKRYWKLPIVYGALGVTGGIFVYNLRSYQELREAVQVRSAYGGFGGVTPTANDTARYNALKQVYKEGVYDIQTLQLFRNQVRQNVDYSALFFILFWALNVVDASVDAHLKSFDVSPDLSFHLRLGNSRMAGTTGVSLVLAFK